MVWQNQQKICGIGEIFKHVQFDILLHADLQAITKNSMNQKLKIIFYFNKYSKFHLFLQI